MAHVHRSLALSRRTVLRGLGAAIALPLLDAMTPAFAAPEPPVLRLVVTYVPNGVHVPSWRPTTEGPLASPPETLAPLAPFASECVVLSGLTLDGARAHGDGPGDHARAAAAFLTGSHPRKTGGADLRAGVSMDQVAAAKLGESTALRSLELGLEGGALAGECDSGYACAYSNNLAWSGPATPLVKTVAPAQVFDRLFGNEGTLSPEERERRRAEDESVLDFALEDARRLRDKLGAADRRKLDEYLTALREAERRVAAVGKDARTGRGSGTRGDAAPARPGVPKDVREHFDLLAELVVLALRGDRTRVVTFMLGNEGSNRTYPFLGVPEAHHATSHHGNDPAKQAAIRKIDRFHTERFASLAERLRGIRDGEDTLLDRTVCLYGSGIADGDRHDHHDLPVFVAGGRAAGLTLGADGRMRHVKSPAETPLANLHLRILDALRVRMPTFGDATGRLSAL